MAATRGELEAVIREQLTRVVAMTLQLNDVPPAATLNRATEAILKDADAYAAATVGDFHARSITGAVHLGADSAVACDSHYLVKSGFATQDATRVTCGSCKRTDAYRCALRVAS